MLETIIIEPHSAATHAIIWLHGLGADGHDFEPIVDELQLPSSLSVRFIFPHAPMQPVSIYGGMSARSWFDIILENNGFTCLEAELKKMSDLIMHLIQGEIANGIPAKNIILAGFSQGGAMAIYTGLQCQLALAGIIALSTFLPTAATSISQAKHTLPIFIGHGTQDDIVPFTRGVELSSAFTQAAFPVTWHSYPMPHSVCAEEVKDIREWIIKVLTP